MHSFSIVIVSWNALNHLKRFLPSVADTNYNEFEIILADNASDDGSVEWVRKHYPEVNIATFDQNYGYCGGNNRGARHAEGDILVFLNNDVKVEPEWLTHLDRCFTQYPEAAAIQPKIRSFSNPKKFEYAGAAGGFLDKYGYPFCRGRIFDTLETDRGQYDYSTEILWASGAALAIKRSVFEQAGGFDEDFEFHMEEIDLCWRLWNSGHTVRYCPESLVYHLGGGSLPMGSARKVYYNYRNNLTMIWKNCSTQSLIWRFPVRYILDLVAAIRSIIDGSMQDFVAICRAHLHFWKSLPATFRKRRNLQKTRTVREDPDTLLPLNIVWSYFIKGKNRFIDLL